MATLFVLCNYFTNYMKKIHDSKIIGKKFGMLTPIKELRIKNRKSFLCICECGNKKNIRFYCLYSGNTTSCGCYRKKQCFKHGYSDTLEYRAWASMRQRCNNKNSKSYKYYGGRGIGICKRWDDFSKFKKDMGKKPSLKHTLDRIDNNGNYEPSNCRWATMEQQANNKSNTVFLKYNGKCLSISQWAAELGIYNSTICRRIKKGWSIERALSK